MAIVPMQKVAVVAHRSKKEELLEFLHKEGVMEIAEMPDSHDIQSSLLPYHGAELDHVIGVLKAVASKQALSAAAKSATEEEITQAGKNPDVRSLIDQVHALEQRRSELDQQLADLEHGRLPSRQPQTLDSNNAEEGAYFTSSKVKEDLSHFGGDGSLDPEEVRALLSGEIRKTQEQLRAAADELRALAEHLPLLTRARQFAAWCDEAEAVRRAMKETRSTVTLFGWIAKRLCGPLEHKLHALSPATALIAMEPNPNEQQPVILQNPSWLKPFESVTSLYGLPKPTEVDPTPLLAPFFIVFFGLCLTDAAYGLLLAAVMGIFIWKKKLTLEKAPLWWLLLVGGLATFLISIPFGGWFGMSPDQAPSFMVERRADGLLWFKGQIWNLGVTEGIRFFQYLSLTLGVLHLSFGFFMAGYMKWRSGSKAEAFWVDWTTLVLFAVCIAYFLLPQDLRQYGLYAIFGALALVVWGKGYGSPVYLRPVYGILGLLNLAMGMLSNTLSYLRLLALGLVTGALAMAVNLVAQQLGGLFPSFIGIPLTVIIYIAGHTLNLALNTLGAFIHSGRLQFVEFFGNFFEGGGKPFLPFRRSGSVVF